jgi:4-methyl-5(b-hydroxyethyl)-thiazole monophosphate biosynthesis
MIKKVLVPIADGIEELEAVTIIDILRRAEIDVTVASVGTRQITASRGVKIVTDALIADCVNEVYDLIVLPGGLPGADNLRDSAELTRMLKDQAASDRLYAAICASPACVLKAHGLLKDKKATCYPSMQSQLPNSQTDNVVVDGNCITSQGPATAMEFALKLVELLAGADIANEIAKALLAK